MHVILALFFTHHSLFKNISHPCLNHAFYISIRDPHRIRNTLYYSTAQTIATSLIHSMVDYCNSLFLNLPRCQLDRLQLILNSAARAVSKTPRYRHISPILKSLHWLKIDQRIQYKVLSLTYKTLQSQNLPISTAFSTFNQHFYSFIYSCYHSSASASQLASQNNG